MESNEQPSTTLQRVQANLRTWLSVSCDLFILIIRVIKEMFISLIRLCIKPKLKNLEGDIVLITGAAQGLGKELAIQYSQHGCTVVLLDYNEAGVQEVAAEINSKRPGSAFSFKCDVSDREEVIAVAYEISTTIGYISVLINNAGVLCCCPLRKHTPTDIRRLFNINVLSHFWTIEAFLPHLTATGRGQIIAMCSMSAFYASPNIACYSATKFAIRGMMDALYLEFRQDPELSFIKFLTVYPFYVATGLVRTYFQSPFMPGLQNPATVVAHIIDAHRRDRRQISIPRSHMPLMNFVSLLPDKVILLIKDFIGTGVHSEL